MFWVRYQRILYRYQATKHNIETYLDDCDRVIYAVGFRPRVIEVEGMEGLRHNIHNGIIALGLFGIGIAFPKQAIDPFGNREESVGLRKFMMHITPYCQFGCVTGFDSSMGIFFI